MFGYEPYTVIRQTLVAGGSDTGIICEWKYGKARVMFETVNNGVEFVWYPLSALARYTVIG